MKKKTDGANRARAAAGAKQKPEIERAAGRLRDAKSEFKRLKLLVKAAKREVKESRKTLKKLRKSAAPPAAKSSVKSNAKPKPTRPAAAPVTASPKKNGAAARKAAPARKSAPPTKSAAPPKAAPEGVEPTDSGTTPA